MNPYKNYLKILRQYPLVRLATLIVLIGASSLLTFMLNKQQHKKPEIRDIEPSIGSAGDIMLINGANFGQNKDSSYIEIAGSRLTSSSYLGWSENQIKVQLPLNVQDGLVTVGTSAGISNPKFFTNLSGIPVKANTDQRNLLPVINSVTPDTGKVGTFITISGSNFGNSKGSSLVYWTANRNDAAETEFLPSTDADFQYESWSDTEIEVRVPDGAAPGQVYVSTAKGQSAASDFTVEYPVGKKTYGPKKTYSFTINAEINNPVFDLGATITLYVPRPITSALQPTSELTNCNPPPMNINDSRVILHQQALSEITGGKKTYTQTFRVTNYAVTSNIKPINVPKYGRPSRSIVNKWTAEDALVPSDNPNIMSLATSIASKQKNPYYQAQAIYSYMIKNFKMTPALRSMDANVLDLLANKTGDAYDWAMIYTALCRASGIPAAPVSGVLVNRRGTVTTHWWVEIYFEQYGWFPVDIVLGAGHPFEAEQPVDNPQTYYFGNLDAQHVAFSKGLNQIKPSMATSKIVTRPKTFAMQSLWEEASASTKSYSTLWSNPILQSVN